jgi:hypothetical protein
MADIVYRFVASGQGDVKSAFRDIGTAANDSAKSFDKSAQAATSGAKTTADGARSAQRPISETAKLAERVAKDQERAAARTAVASEKASKRAADAAAHAASATSKAADKSATAAAKAAEKAANAEVKAAKKAADAHSRALDHVAQIRSRHDQQQERLAARGAAATERAAKRSSDRRSGAIGSLAKDGAIATVGGAAAALGVVGAAARDGMRLQDASNRLSISARGAGEKGADPTALRKEFEAAVVDAPGIKAADVAEATAGFVAKTGDLESGRKFAPTFATAASATGADVQDIANAAADISQKFDIKGVEEMQAALAALTFQGKKGAFELKDAASQFAKMSAAAERFGLAKGSSGLKTLGGLTQIARSATGSPEQAATAVEAMFRQLVGESKKLKAMGVEVFKPGTNNTQTNDVRDVIVDSIAKAGGSLPKLQKIYGEEGIRGISPLISTFNQTKNAATGTEAEKTAAGVAALRAALADAIDAPGDWAEVVKDAAQAQKGSSAQLDAAWERLKAQVADQVVPALGRIIPKLAGMEGMIEPAIVVFEKLVEAGGDVVSLFKLLGLIHPKEVTPAGQLQKARKDLATFNNTMDSRIGPMSVEELTKKTQLETAVKTADKGEASTVMTPDKFIAAYTGATRWEHRSDSEKKRAEGDARKLAQSLSLGEGGREVNDLRDIGETDEQQKLVRRFAADAGLDKRGSSEGGTPANGGDVGDSGAIALNEAAKSLKSAADALKASGQGSITGKSVTGGTSP